MPLKRSQRRQGRPPCARTPLPRHPAQAYPEFCRSVYERASGEYFTAVKEMEAAHGKVHSRARALGQPQTRGGRCVCGGVLCSSSAALTQGAASVCARSRCGAPAHTPLAAQPAAHRALLMVLWMAKFGPGLVPLKDIVASAKRVRVRCSTARRRATAAHACSRPLPTCGAGRLAACALGPSAAPPQKPAPCPLPYPSLLLPPRPPQPRHRGRGGPLRGHPRGGDEEVHHDGSARARAARAGGGRGRRARGARTG